MPQVTVDNRIVSVRVGTHLAALLPDLERPCGGKGICGKCKVRVWGEVSPLSPQEQRHLTSIEVADGIRLACCTTVQGDCRVQRLDTAPMTVCAAGELGPVALRPGFTRYGVAVDIGTTTLAARLYASDGTLLAERGASNPQSAFGADVVSRVEAALKGQGEAVTAAIRRGLCDLLTELTAGVGYLPEEVDGLVITGNTVMLTLLVGGDVNPFAAAPFDCRRLFGETVTAAQAGLSVCPHAAVYLTPCVSAFVGGDAAAAMEAVGLGEQDTTALLLDIGTNGEMVLWHQGTLYACSTAAGPAFEGVGISCGMTGRPGAIDRVELAGGRLYPHVIGGGEARGLCGSGLVDAVACLLVSGELTADGCLDTPVALTDRVSLTPEDIRTVQVSKSALRSGVDSLLHAAGIPAGAVDALYIAGGFGSYLNIANAVRIGLLSPELTRRVRVLGNAALSGASRLLLDTGLREQSLRRTAGVRVVELATDPYFAQQFIHNMTFSI